MMYSKVLAPQSTKVDRAYSQRSIKIKIVYKYRSLFLSFLLTLLTKSKEIKKKNSKCY